MIIEKKGKTADVRIKNNLTQEYSKEFVEKMKGLITDDIKRFNIDFNSVSYIDSLALSNLIIFCDKSDLEFTFKNVSSSLHNIFMIIKIDKLVVLE